MIYTESEQAFWKYHSMGCGYCGEFRRKKIFPEDPETFECPVCGSEYRPSQEIDGQAVGFAGDSVDMFSRATDPELIEEMEKRGYTVRKL